MDCERARAEFVDGLTGALGEAERAELRAHIEQCAVCRAETEGLADTWRVLGALGPPAHDPSLPERFEHRLERVRADRWPSWRSWLAQGAVAAALVIGFGLGSGWQARRTGDGTAVGEARSPSYLMLLREGPSVPAADARAVYEEYAAWAHALAAEGRLVSAEELADGGAWLVAGADEPTAHPTPQAASQPVVGFFWIQAASVDSAVAHARASPHLRRGGTIEIRAIQRQ